MSNALVLGVSAEELSREAGIDDEGPDVSFVAGPIEIDVDVEVENGQIKVRVRTENDDTGERTEAFFFYPIS